MKLRQTLTCVWPGSARLQMISALCLTFMFVAPASAQDDAPAAESKAAAPADESADESADDTPKDPETLKDDAEAISGRYERFERLLSQMADLMAVEDPDRAELLRRAISQTREKALKSDIDAIAELLGDESFGDAIEKQESSVKAMAALLRLLQSEDRRSALEKERERLNELLKGVRNAISQQRATRSRTQNSQAPSHAAPGQQKAIEQTDDVLQDIKDHDQARNEGADGESKDGESKDGESKDGESKDGESKDGESKDGESKDGESKDGESKDGESSDGESSDGESQESQSESQSGQQSQSGGQQQQTPGREQLEQAQKKMQEALDQLKKQQKEDALKNQDQAIAELEKAARELEELLKQLREEEKEMVLAALEARFQRMLALQTQIYETTVDLDATERQKWLDTAVSKCRELAQEQVALTAECTLTAALLREDGTSVAILLAVEDIEIDMGSVADRLQGTKTGSLTQTLETDIIEALKELIEATQQEMQEMKEQQQGQQQQGQQQNPDLVDLMAEIKVLRSLQLRVNRRTRRINDLLAEPEVQSSGADIADLQEQLAELARRQDRLRESAIELAKKLEQKR